MIASHTVYLVGKYIKFYNLYLSYAGEEQCWSNYFSYIIQTNKTKQQKLDQKERKI